MARYNFGGDLASFTILAPSGQSNVVKSQPNATGSVYAARTGGSALTDLLDANGAAATTVSSDTNGFLNRFQGPDGIRALWVDFGGGSRFYIRASDGVTQKMQIDVVSDCGADPTGVADSTAALTAAAALVPTTGGRIYFPPGTYKVSSLADAASLMSFTSKSNLVIDAAEATISNPTSYTADTVTAIFKFDACTNVRVTLGAYVGYTLPTPATHLGYRGCTVVYAINATDGLKVAAKITNARYGVLTGDYASASLGGSKNLDLRLRTSFCGYPVAAYLAEGIRLDVDADDVHRAAYIAGCDDVTGTVRYKNNYVAQVAVLLTDALTSGTDAVAQVAPPANPTTSRGCSNVKLTAIDKGSTTFIADTYVAGISLSRVDPGTAFRNIDVRVHTTATDTVSTTVHGFIINSTANSVWSRYSFNWETTLLLENVKIGGVVDKSATTAAVATGSNGPITLRTDDPAGVTHTATIRNLVIEDFLVRRGTQSYIARLYVRGLATPMVVNRLAGPDAAGTAALYVLVAGSTAQPIFFNECVFATLDMAVVTNALVALGPGTAITAPDADRTVYATGGTLRGTGPRRVTKIITTAALSGANQTLTGAIPAGAVDVRVQARITTALTGASGFQVGVSGDLTRYGDITGTGTGTLLAPTNHAASAFTTTGSYAAATDLIVTAKTANFTAGVIRLAVHYWEYPAVAS